MAQDGLARRYCTGHGTSTPSARAACSGQYGSRSSCRARKTASAAPSARIASACAGSVMSPTAPVAIIACGGISGYNDEKPRPGPSNLFNITTKRLTVKGLMVFDWLDRQAEFEKEVGGYFKAGKVKHKETVVPGIDQAVGAFIGLFQGQNVGKMVVKLT